MQIGQRMSCILAAASAISALATSAMADVTLPLTETQQTQLVQSALTIMNEDPGPIDGRIGPQTRGALQNYLDAADLNGDPNNIDQALLDGLNDRAGPAIAEAFGYPIDGQWTYVTSVLERDQIEPALARLGVAPPAACDGISGDDVTFDGLLVQRGTDIVFVMTMSESDEGGAGPLNPRPESLEWEGGMYRPVSADILAYAAEGSFDVYLRCGA